MRRRTLDRLMIFHLIAAPALLAFSLCLDRWYACVPLIGYLGWTTRRWLPPAD